MNQRSTNARAGARRLALMIGASMIVASCSAGGGASTAGAATGPGAAAQPAATGVAADASDPAADTTPDPCKLLTRAEATKLAGVQLPVGQDSGDPPSMCQFTAPSTGPTAQVEVFVGDGAKKMLDIDRGLGHKFAPVPGVGDEAYEEDFNVFVRKGTVWSAIDLVRLEDAAQFRDALRTAASEIAGRL